MVTSEETKHPTVKTLAEDLLHNLSVQRSEGRFCDVQLTNGSSKIWAHSCVLSIVSPFMMRYFIKHLDELNDWSVNKPFQLNISTLTKCWGESKNNCMICVLNSIDYIYTGKIKLTVDHIGHVVNLANNLELDNLLLICQKFKKDNNINDEICSDDQSNNLPSTVDISELNSDATKENRVFGEISFEDLKSPEPVEESNDDEQSITDAANAEVNKLIDLKDIVTLPDEILKRDQSDENNIYSCEVCGYLSKNDEQFLIHDFVFHRYDYTCLSCTYEDKSITNIIEHLLTEKHEVSLCSICLLQTHDKERMKIHVKDHLNDKPFVCSFCSMRFETRSEWLKHFALNCSTKTFNISDIISKDPDDYTSKESCATCKFSFPSETQAKKHQRVFHKNKYTCLTCDYNTYKIEKLIKHLKLVVHHETDCSLCLYEGKSREGLKLHLEDHLDDKFPFKCWVCMAKYPNRRQWWRHVATHFNEKPFKCLYCQLAFKNTVLLNTHVLRMHKTKKYICAVCGLAAPFPSLLEKHQKIHKTQRPEYVCTFEGCDFKTKVKNHFIKHKKEHTAVKVAKRKETKKDAFVCSHCKLTFSLDKNLKRHVKLKHSSFVQNFQCPRCNYTSVRLDKLKYHLCNVHHDLSEKELNEIMKTLKNQFPQVINSDLLNPPSVEPPPLPEINNVEEIIPEPMDEPPQSVTSLPAENENEKIPEEVEESLFPEENDVETFDEQSNSILDMELENDLQKIENDLQAMEEEEEKTKEKMRNDNNDMAMEQYMSETGKKTLFLNKTTGEINIFSGNEGKPIPIASVTSTNLLTIGNFRKGTGSVTLNETTGVLTLSNINSGSTGAVFLNESTGELSYIDLNGEDNGESHDLLGQDSYPQEQLELNLNTIGIELREQFQLDEVTGEIVKLDDEHSEDKNNQKDESMDFEDLDFNIGNFNDDSFDGFDEFDEMIFDNLSEDMSEQGEDDEPKHQPTYRNLNEQTPRLNEMTGEFIFDETSDTQDVWNELRPFRDIDDVGDDSILENVNNGSYNYLLNEITGEFYQ